MLPFIDDSTIIQDNSGDVRTYYDVASKNKTKWASVTALTKWASNKSAMFQQMIAEKPHLQQEWQERAALGTRVHKALETGCTSHLSGSNEIKYYNNYQRYLTDVVNSVAAKEKKLIWEGSVNNIPVGFGGTNDAVHLIDYNKLYYSDGTTISSDTTNNLSFSVIDYKTKQTNKLNSHPEYGLEHYLQCAANTAALNKRYNCAYNANKSLVLVSTSRNLYIYYLWPEAIQHYWTAFKDILFHYYTNRTYNWKALEESSVKYWPYRVYLDAAQQKTENQL